MSGYAKHGTYIYIYLKKTHLKVTPWAREIAQWAMRVCIPSPEWDGECGKYV